MGDPNVNVDRNGLRAEDLTYKLLGAQRMQVNTKDTRRLTVVLRCTPEVKQKPKFTLHMREN